MIFIAINVDTLIIFEFHSKLHMKKITRKCIGLLSIATMSMTGCETMSPGASGALVGGLTGVAAGVIAKKAGASSSDARLIGVAAGVTTAVIVYAYQKRRATEREQAVVRQRAAEYQQRVASRSRPAAKSRYVAVPAEQGASKSGTVMIFDTKTEKVVGNQAYELEKTPKKGEVVKLDTINAEYVGS